MYNKRTQRGIETLQLSLQVRQNNKIDIVNSFCVFDLAEEIGIEVKFVDIPSMEGLYITKPKKIILISSHRPMGRQRFTCAHELGHHFFGHKGIHIDEINTYMVKKKSGSSKEIKADIFASYLLMPATTVNNGFIRRGWDLQTATPLQVYTVACWLGVGYTTLIDHLQFGLKKVSNDRANFLKKSTPQKIKKSILGYYCQENVITVDFGWTGRPIDVFCGDMLVFENKVELDGINLKYSDEIFGKHIYQAICPGIGRVFNEDKNWASFVRVSRTNYIGRCKFRHLEDN